MAATHSTQVRKHRGVRAVPTGLFQAVESDVNPLGLQSCCHHHLPEASISFRNFLVRSRTSRSFDTALRPGDGVLSPWEDPCSTSGDCLGIGCVMTINHHKPTSQSLQCQYHKTICPLTGSSACCSGFVRSQWAAACCRMQRWKQRVWPKRKLKPVGRRAQGTRATRAMSRTDTCQLHRLEFRMVI